MNYEKGKVKLKNTQLKKLKKKKKSGVKKTGATLRITKKDFQEEELPNELFLTTSQKTKTRNASAKNMSTDTKLRELSRLKQFNQVGFLAIW